MLLFLLFLIFSTYSTNNTRFQIVIQNQLFDLSKCETIVTIYNDLISLDNNNSAHETIATILNNLLPQLGNAEQASYMSKVLNEGFGLDYSTIIKNNPNPHDKQFIIDQFVLKSNSINNII